MGGGLYYPVQTTVVLIGSKSSAGAITSSALTTSYSNNQKVISTAGMYRIDFRVKYTTGASETATSIHMFVETSGDNVTFYPFQNEAISTGTSTLYERTLVRAGGAGATSYYLSATFETASEYVRFSAKEAGVSSNAGSVFVEATLSGR